MTEWVVLRQNELNDLWDALFVNVDAESSEAAIEWTAKEERSGKGGEGRYIAVPNEYWVAQNVTVTRIAEVAMERQEMV